jgi:hypothetical protein
MPTECSAERYDFGLVGRREVVGSFDGGAITSEDRYSLEISLRPGLRPGK